MIKIYGIPNCDTMKKAFDWLKENDLEFEFHNYKKEGISKDKLETWIKKEPWEKILNKTGSTFKKLNEEEKSAINKESSAIDFLLQNSSGIKRPVLEFNDKILVGFKPEYYAEQLL